MHEFYATLSTKGQITLPKTIRDILNVDTGDQLTFTVQPNNQIVIQKSVNSIKFKTKLNLISFLLQNNFPILIKGEISSGKTYFTQKLIKSMFKDKKVAIIQPSVDEYALIVKDMEHFKSFVSYDLNNLLPEFKDTHYDLVVIEESQCYDFDSIKQIFSNQDKLILISHSFNHFNLLELGNHFLISISRNDMCIDFFEIIDNTFVVKSIYID